MNSPELIHQLIEDLETRYPNHLKKKGSILWQKRRERQKLREKAAAAD